MKESAKSGKLSKVGNAFRKTGQKADDFVDDLVTVTVVNKFDDFVVIANKFPDEALPKDGRILTATIKEGKILGINGKQHVDFIVTKNGELVLGDKHAFFANGKDVFAAGTLKIDGTGVVKRITNESGHYRPTVSESMQFEKILQELDIDLSKAWVNYYEFTVNTDNLIIDQKLIVNQQVVK